MRFDSEDPHALPWQQAEGRSDQGVHEQAVADYHGRTLKRVGPLNAAGVLSPYRGGQGRRAHGVHFIAHHASG